MKTYRVYEGFKNEAGGVEGCGAGWEYVEAETATDAAKAFWGAGWPDAGRDTVIVATDDEGDSAHYYPVLFSNRHGRFSS